MCVGIWPDLEISVWGEVAENAVDVGIGLVVIVAVDNDLVVVVILGVVRGTWKMLDL